MGPVSPPAPSLNARAPDGVVPRPVSPPPHHSTQQCQRGGRRECHVSILVPGGITQRNSARSTGPGQAGQPASGQEGGRRGLDDNQNVSANRPQAKNGCLVPPGRSPMMLHPLPGRSSRICWNP